MEERSRAQDRRVSSEAATVQARGCGVLILVAEGRVVVREFGAGGGWRGEKTEDRTKMGEG